MRYEPLLALLLLLPVAPIHGQDQEQTVPAARFDPGTPFQRAYALPPGKTAVAEPACVIARIHEDRVVFVDLDGNGKHLDFGVDGWTIAGGQYVVPVEERIVVGCREIALTSVTQECVTFVATPIRLGHAHLDGLLVLNRLRLKNGLPPVGHDAELAVPATAHARYCDLNDSCGHDEIPGKPGYSKEGHASGRASVVSTQDPRGLVEQMYPDLFHRTGLFSPHVWSVGIGHVGGHTVIDVDRNRRERHWTLPWKIPAPGTGDHPLAFPYEYPVPHHQELKYEGLELTSGRTPLGGFPITLTFETDDVVLVDAELRERSSSGKLVPCRYSWPKRSASHDLPRNCLSICLMPRELLASKQVYWVWVRYLVAGKERIDAWRFATQGIDRVPPNAKKTRPKLQKARLSSPETRDGVLSVAGQEERAGPHATSWTRLSKTKVHFVDVDGDGGFLTFGTDVWRLSEAGPAFPLAERITLGGATYRLVSGTRALQLEYHEVSSISDKDCRQVVAALNAARATEGRPPIPISLVHSEACRVRVGGIEEAYWGQRGLGIYTSEQMLWTEGKPPAAARRILDEDRNREMVLDPRALAVGISRKGNRYALFVVGL